MSSSARGSNRGPAAAAENRHALLRAARELFAEKGYNVPLSAIARAAGVGQAVLYRHFPRRLDLAFAVFEENFTELEVLAADQGPDAFERFFARLVDLMIESLGFVELVVGARADYEDGAGRLAALVTGPLARAQRAGVVAGEVTIADVDLALRMVYGVAVTALDDEQRARDVRAVHAELLTRWRT